MTGARENGLPAARVARGNAWKQNLAGRGGKDTPHAESEFCSRPFQKKQSGGERGERNAYRICSHSRKGKRAEAVAENREESLKHRATEGERKENLFTPFRHYRIVQKGVKEVGGRRKRSGGGKTAGKRQLFKFTGKLNRALGVFKKRRRGMQDTEGRGRASTGKRS